MSAIAQDVIVLVLVLLLLLTHGGKVEGADSGRDTEGLPVADAVHATGNPVEGVPEELGRQKAGRLDHLETPKDVPFGVGKGFAILEGDEGGQVVGPVTDALLELQHDPLALLDGNLPPLLEGCPRLGHSPIELVGSHLGDHSQDLVGCWVSNGMSCLTHAVDPFSILKKLVGPRALQPGLRRSLDGRRDCCRGQPRQATRRSRKLQCSWKSHLSTMLATSCDAWIFFVCLFLMVLRFLESHSNKSLFLVYVCVCVFWWGATCGNYLSVHPGWWWQGDSDVFHPGKHVNAIVSFVVVTM